MFVVVSASWYTLSMTEDNPKHLSPPIAALQTEHERDWEDLRIVTGFLPWIDTLPETASKHGLPCRVAVILNHSGVPHSRLYWDAESLRGLHDVAMHHVHRREYEGHASRVNLKDNTI